MRLLVYGLGLAYEAIILSLGFALLSARASAEGLLKPGLAFLLAGLGDLMHTLGLLAVDLAQGSWLAHAISSFLTALDIALATTALLLIRLYVSSFSRQGYGMLDKALIAVLVITASLALTAASLKLIGAYGLYWPLLGVAVMLMAITGYISCMSLFVAAQKGILPTYLRARGKRVKLLWGSALGMVAITLALLHPLAAPLPLAMLLITALKVAFLSASGLLIGLGLLPPQPSM